MRIKEPLLALTLTVVLGCAAAQAAEKPADLKFVKVSYEKGRFAAWPANWGVWIWGNEILVGFSRGMYNDLGPKLHNIDREKPEEHLLARSLDGGETWAIENPAEKGYLIPQGDAALHGTELPGVPIPEPTACPGGIDFTHPDFCMTLRMSDIQGGVSRFYYSHDRGHNWEGPFRLPDFVPHGTAARTCYLVDGQHTCTLLLTASKRDGEEGRPICVRTLDGGKTWNFLSFIGPEPKGYAIMPSAARLSPTDIYTVIRRRDFNEAWLSAFRSRDNGLSWERCANPVDDTGAGGNPPSLLKLRDGRLSLVYGVRRAPFRMCAKLSSDGGETWGGEIVLRDDGGGRDLGYPASVQRPDGKVVSLYYFWDAATGPERYLEAAIWDPASVK